jgi:hypothetical protein
MSFKELLSVLGKALIFSLPDFDVTTVYCEHLVTENPKVVAAFHAQTAVGLKIHFKKQSEKKKESATPP